MESFDRRRATSVAAKRTAPAAVSICTNRENGRVRRSTSALGSLAGVGFTSRLSAIKRRDDRPTVQLQPKAVGAHAVAAGALR